MTITTDMLDALRQWAAAERDNDHAELANARLARDQAIEAAARFDAAVPGAVYAVVTSDELNGKYLSKALAEDPARKPCPIVWETRVNGNTLAREQRRAAELERFGYGACRVARLVFEDEPGFAS